MLALEHANVALHILIGLGNGEGDSGLVDQAPVLPVSLFRLGRLEVGLVVAYPLLFLAFLLPQFSQVVRRIGDCILRFGLLRHAVVLGQMRFCLLYILHLQVALGQTGVRLHFLDLQGGLALLLFSPLLVLPRLCLLY